MRLMVFACLRLASRYPAFSLRSPCALVSATCSPSYYVVPVSGLQRNVLAFHLLAGAEGEPSEGLYIVFNGNPTPQQAPLPPGTWSVHVDHLRAGIEPLSTARKRIKLPPFSAMMLVKEPE